MHSYNIPSGGPKTNHFNLVKILSWPILNDVGASIFHKKRAEKDILTG
jgi:hypothetical protein